MNCPNCDGLGGGWPENPTLCGGLPCPECEGVCETCYGEPWPPIKVAYVEGSVKRADWYTDTRYPVIENNTVEWYTANGEWV